ncbi:interferon-induced very large GTPase 1-like isoform X2 [Xenia sp. Carnegie-2017]|nr:interferon-induced very large GTPase 1-like isoform X2 [Xenia sp. Carnegie-2017]
MSKNNPSNDINEQKGKLGDNEENNVANSSIKEENVDNYKEYGKDSEKYGIFRENADEFKNGFGRIRSLTLSHFNKLKFLPESKLTLKHARTVDNQTFTDDRLNSHDQIPNYILKTLMIADYHAREFTLKPLNSNQPGKVCNTLNDEYGSDSDSDDDGKENEMNSDKLKSESVEGVNPMDALLGIFHCSDDFLRRDIAVKLSACQLSVPFILPHPDMPTESVTILLSALETITKSWKGSSSDNTAKEVYATEHPFPIVSFIRVGNVTMSKSSLMNKIISDGNGDHEFFFHKNIKGGDVKRKVVDGLVELVWYLPGGCDKNALKNEICFANLRGDAQNFKKQVNILKNLSNVLCILLPSEMPDEHMKNFLNDALLLNGKNILIFNEKRREEERKFYNGLKNQHSTKLSFFTKAQKPNEYNFLQSIHQAIMRNIKKDEVKSLVELREWSKESGACFDDDKPYVDLGKTVETWLTSGYNKAKNLFKLQSHIPVFADLERKKLNPKVRRSNENTTRQNEADELYKEIEKERDAQMWSFERMDDDVVHFLNWITVLDEAERNRNLYRVKHSLDKTSLSVMTKLHQQYRQASLSFRKRKKNFDFDPEVPSQEEKHLKELEASISRSSFGLEHIIRELSQLYQLPNVVTIDYAGAAAEILLSGHPLELLDGDSGYIPMKWFNAVFKKLERKTKNARIYVISVLGIQSSGKSTMLNTMFGLEFPASAGRCTCGAFASLIPVSEQVRSESNFDYILIIDTEGLRGLVDPKLREHDNELATFAIGVADVTIVNIFGENHNEMKEFLQMAVHAFLKMKLVKEKKTCKIVHQNVAATDAEDKLITDRHNLKQDLDKMAKLAAKHENCEEEFQKLDDIIAFDENEDVFYIPSLLKGSPPMAPINPNYGRAVQEVKDNIIHLMCSKVVSRNNISVFRERVNMLWKAMLKENFIFSFRNVIEVRAFTSLDKKYFEEYVKNLVNGMAEVERKVQVDLKRCTTREERYEQWIQSKLNIRKEAEDLKKKMENSMKSFFESSEDSSTLEQWKENIMNRILQYKENHQMTVMKSCEATFNHLQQRQEVEEKKLKYEKQLLQRARAFITSGQNTDDMEKCKAAFQQEWEQCIKEVPAYEEQKKDVNSEMVEVLCDTNPAFNVDMVSKLSNKKWDILNFHGVDPFIDVNKLSLQQSILQKFGSLVGFGKNETVVLAKNIKDEAVSKGYVFAKNTSKTAVRYSRDHLTRMYHEVTSTIEKAAENERFKFKKELICDILIYTFALTVKIFDEMEQRYCEERDIRRDLELNLRPRLETYFVNLCNEMEKEVLAANSLVDVLLEPIKSELNKTMGPAVTGELLTKSMFQSKGPYHASVLIQLGEQSMFELFVPYFENPVKFLEGKLQESVEDYCLKKEPSLVQLLVKKETQKIESNISSAIEFASKLAKQEIVLGGGKFKVINWINHFVLKCSTLAITKEMFGVATMDEDLKDIDVFDTKIRQSVSEFVKTLAESDVDKETVGKWDPAPHENLFPAMFGCKCVCPFCKGLCDQTIEGHPGNHSTRIHRPQGLTGYHDIESKVLISEICTLCVAGERRFKNTETNWEWCKYKDYQSVNDYYKSWTIPPDPSFEPSKYWQWFIVKFSKKLAEHYKKKEPDIPSAWKDVTFKEAKEQLQETYNL